ncbi:MAG TPA: MarR family transcriptional regulator [Gemmatimonadaceae bacterium]|nr:MarR family transcriptional regulator [Gemmatimonadaceae bacterium]
MNDMAPEQPSAAAAPANVMAVLHAAHAVEAKLEAACGRAGLSMAKFSVLSQLVEAGEPLALGELAERLSCVRSNMTQLIDRLEAEGFVRRVSCPTDRRSVKAEISELGRERQAVAAVEFAKVNAEIVGLVQPEDHAAIERFARALG